MCDHKNTKAAMLKKIFKTQTFRTKGQVCVDCGAEFWTADLHHKYMAWLGKLYSGKSTKELFTVQVLMPAGSIKAFENIATEYPGVTSSDIIRALFAVYNDYVAPNPSVASSIEDLAEIAISGALRVGKKTRINVRFKPAVFENLAGLSQAFTIPEAKIVENGVISMLVVLDFCASVLQATPATPEVSQMLSFASTIATILKAS